MDSAYLLSSTAEKRLRHCSDPEVEPRSQGPAHTPGPVDSFASTAVDHDVTPCFFNLNQTYWKHERLNKHTSA